MRLWAERAERHARRDEALADLGDRFDLVDRHRGRALAVEAEQIADRERLGLVHHLAVLLERGIGIGCDRVLQLVDRRAVQSVPFAAASIAVQAADLERRIVVCVSPPVQRQHLLLNTGVPDAGEPRVQPREILCAQRTRQADRLEIVAAAIAADDRDAHLGDDLEQALIHGLFVAPEAVVQGEPGEQAARVALGDRRLGEIGVHCRRAGANQHRNVVHVQTLARAHRNRAEAAQALPHQVAVHGADREDHRDRRARLGHPLVAQHDLLVALAHCVLGLNADAGECLAQRAGVSIDLERAVDRGCLRPEVVEEGLELDRQQQRALQQQDLRLAGRLVVHVAEIAVAGLQAHHPIFPQRIDRRIGHLAELLAEEVMQPAVARRQHRHGRVVAHGAHRLLGVEHHGREQQLELLVRDAEQILAPAQLGALHLHRRDRLASDQIVEMRDVLHPLAVGLLAGEQILELLIAVEHALPQVHPDHLAGSDPALLDDAAGRQRHHAGLRSDHEQIVVGACVAHRPQAVAIHAPDHPVAIACDHRGRPVPRLHHAVAVAEQVLVRLRDGHLARPRRRNQQRLDERQRAPGAHQGLDHGIQRGAVGAARLDDRLDVLVVLAERRRHHSRLVALHPVQVAAQRIDLAIVRERAERLRQLPRRPGVGRVALMEHREAGDEARVLQVGIKHRQLFGQEQPLVDDRPARQRADVKAVDVLGQHLLLDAPADQEQLALELVVAHVLGVADDDLLDLGPRGDRLLADHRGVDRHLAPAQDGVAEAEDLGLHDRAAALLAGEVGARQEHHADREAPRHILVAVQLLPEKVLRDLEIDPGAVAGLAVGIDRAAMPHRAQGIDRRLDHLAPRLAVDRGHEADPARGVLVGRIVQAMACQMSRVSLVVRDKPLRCRCLLGCHRAAPQDAKASAGALACRCA